MSSANGTNSISCIDAEPLRGLRYASTHQRDLSSFLGCLFVFDCVPKSPLRGTLGVTGLSKLEVVFNALTNEAGAIVNKVRRRWIHEYLFKPARCFGWIGGGAQDRAALT